MGALEGNYESSDYNNIDNNSFNITNTNSLLQSTLNNNMSAYFVQWWNSEITGLAINIDQERKTALQISIDEKWKLKQRCKIDIQEMKFQCINEKFWNSVLLEALFNDLRNELGIDLTKSLGALDNFIVNSLKFPEWNIMDQKDYQQMIDNVRTIIIMQFENISKIIYKAKEKNGWSFENLQWMINWHIQESLEEIRVSVLTSAKYYLEIQNPETKIKLAEKIGTLHINKRERQIKESFIDKNLVIDLDNWWLDFAQETEDTKEINSIPTDILLNDSFLTADKVKNRYSDMYLIKNDLDGDWETIWESVWSLKNISVLNDKDQQTEIEFIIASLALDAFASIPWAWSILSVGIASQDLFSDYNSTIETLKAILPDLDQNYSQQNTSLDYVSAIGTIGISIIWLQSAIKWLKIASQVKHLKSLNVSAELITQMFRKVGMKFWFSLDKINQLMWLEQKAFSAGEKILKEDKRMSSFQEKNILWST